MIVVVSVCMWQAKWMQQLCQSKGRQDVNVSFQWVALRCPQKLKRWEKKNALKSARTKYFWVRRRRLTNNLVVFWFLYVCAYLQQYLPEGVNHFYWREKVQDKGIWRSTEKRWHNQIRSDERWLGWLLVPHTAVELLVHFRARSTRSRPKSTLSGWNVWIENLKWDLVSDPNSLPSTSPQYITLYRPHLPPPTHRTAR